MIEIPIERNADGRAKAQFLLTGFTQASGIRTYTFEARINAQRNDYTVAVDLALIAGYGIRIQDLPLLCRELLQQETDEVTALVFTEQRMRSHAEKLTLAREEAASRKKHPKPLPAVEHGAGWQIR